MGVVRGFEGDGGRLGGGCEVEEGNIRERVKRECACMCCKMY